MAKKAKLEEIEVNDLEVVSETVAPKLETKTYTVAAKWQVGDTLYKKGDKIELTKEGYRFYKKLNKIN